ncbi:hypothetical protein N7449_011042 [Penicillium cf. viridicatum]|uniref:Uncharacterized protein n=1 Tax=Penicillium cf. viridicatum TaxID=2972119 RepID=A0A9W9M297_9EURO|nr:hypothetical protein N7449_011042 [Penicillium cf. viridicatum]
MLEHMSVQNITVGSISRSSSTAKTPSDQCGRLLPPREASPTDEAFMAAQISMYDQMAIKMLFAQKGFTAVGISTDKGTRRDGGSTGR